MENDFCDVKSSANHSLALKNLELTRARDSHVFWWTKNGGHNGTRVQEGLRFFGFDGLNVHQVHC